MQKPSKLWSFLKLAFAAPVSLGFFAALIGGGWEGPGICLFFGLILGLMVRLCVVGLAGLAGRRLPGRAT